MAGRAYNNRCKSNVRASAFSVSTIERILSAFVLTVVIAALVFGYLSRHDTSINPHHGIGYGLGIIGGVLMLVLLGYPIRKQIRGNNHAMGSVGVWFRFHMLLGLFGPLAILYHARFSWGALNSAFALGAMIVVACSGLVGRFFYSRVHRGYSVRKLEIRELKQEMEAMLHDLEVRGVDCATVEQVLHPFEARAVAAGANFWSSAAAVVSLGYATRLAERQMVRTLPALHDEHGQDLHDLITTYFEVVRRAAEFAFYDRLLRLWHLLHLPLFILLVLAAVLHVVAVHMY